MKFHIAIDKREHDIYKHFCAINNQCDANNKIIEYKLEHLTIGDFIIFVDGRALIVIERKTWKDLAQSICDGRIKNIVKLIQYRTQTNAKIAYLIEGKQCPLRTSKFGRIPYKNLRSHLDHLLFRDGIIELQSKSLADTVERLYEFTRNLSTLPTELLNNTNKNLKCKSDNDSQVELELNDNDNNDNDNNDDDNNDNDNNDDDNNDNDNDNDNNDNDNNDNDNNDNDDNDNAPSDLELAKVKFAPNEYDIICKIWCCVAGINYKTVKLFVLPGAMSTQWHISDLIQGKINLQTISDLKFNNGITLGLSRAKKIHAVVNVKSKKTKDIYAKMISCIPGISLKTAKNILEEVSMLKILTEFPQEKLEQIRKGEKSKLGINLTKKIKFYFYKKN